MRNFKFFFLVLGLLVTAAGCNGANEGALDLEGFSSSGNSTLSNNTTPNSDATHNTDSNPVTVTGVPNPGGSVPVLPEPQAQPPQTPPDSNPPATHPDSATIPTIPDSGVLTEQPNSPNVAPFPGLPGVDTVSGAYHSGSSTPPGGGSGGGSPGGCTGVDGVDNPSMSVQRWRECI